MSADKKIKDTVAAAVDLDMNFSEIVKEVRRESGYGLSEGLQLAAYEVRELHRKGNQNATWIIKRWNEISESNKIRL